MARGGHAVLDVNFDKVFQNLDLLITKVDRGTKKATLEAVKWIYNQSLNEVPSDTGTLARSAYYRVDGNYRTGFTGVVGYGGNGNPTNPKSGQEASRYMIVVHEDMFARHDNGKAKYLEDPIKEYQEMALGRYASFIRTDMGF